MSNRAINERAYSVVRECKKICDSVLHFFIIYFADIHNKIQVSRYLTCLNKEELKLLGELLGLSHATVTNHFDSTLAVYRSSIVEAWLLKQDEVAEKGGTSWSTLEAALRDELLGHNGIADKIHRELEICVLFNCSKTMWSSPLGK